MYYLWVSRFKYLTTKCKVNVLTTLLKHVGLLY